jgi:rubrerythrin
MKKYKCKKCSYEWESRKETPISCPRCKRYDYDKEDSQLEKCKEVIQNGKK